jgi:hypothetical protein
MNLGLVSRTRSFMWWCNDSRLLSPLRSGLEVDSLKIAGRNVHELYSRCERLRPGLYFWPRAVRCALMRLIVSLAGAPNVTGRGLVEYCALHKDECLLAF